VALPGSPVIIGKDPFRSVTLRPSAFAEFAFSSYKAK